MLLEIKKRRRKPRASVEEKVRRTTEREM